MFQNWVVAQFELLYSLCCVFFEIGIRGLGGIKNGSGREPRTVPLAFMRTALSSSSHSKNKVLNPQFECAERHFNRRDGQPKERDNY